MLSHYQMTETHHADLSLSIHERIGKLNDRAYRLAPKIADSAMDSGCTDQTRASYDNLGPRQREAWDLIAEAYGWNAISDSVADVNQAERFEAEEIPYRVEYVGGMDPSANPWQIVQLRRIITKAGRLGTLTGDNDRYGNPYVQFDDGSFYSVPEDAILPEPGTLTPGTFIATAGDVLQGVVTEDPAPEGHVSVLRVGGDYAIPVHTDAIAYARPATPAEIASAKPQPEPQTGCNSENPNFPGLGCNLVAGHEASAPHYAMGYTWPAEPEDTSWPAGKTFGELTPAQRRTAMRAATAQLQAELQANSEAIGKAMDEAVQVCPIPLPEPTRVHVQTPGKAYDSQGRHTGPGQWLSLIHEANRISPEMFGQPECSQRSEGWTEEYPDACVIHRSDESVSMISKTAHGSEVLREAARRLGL